MIMEARVQALVVEAHAIRTEIDGMNADNMQRIILNRSVAYNANQYQEKADQLRGIAGELQELGRE